MFCNYKDEDSPTRPEVQKSDINWTSQHGSESATLYIDWSSQRGSESATLRAAGCEWCKLNMMMTMNDQS